MSAVSSIIRIDPDDELPAILERLPTGAPCVLVLPPHARALNSVVGAKLLNRRAGALGSRLAVVTDDHAMMAHARAAGVPVAPTVDAAQRILHLDTAEAEPTVVWDPRSHSLDEREANRGQVAGAESHEELPHPEAVTFTAGSLEAQHNGHLLGTESSADGAAHAAPGQDDPLGQGQAAPATIRGHSGGTSAAQRRGSVVPGATGLYAPAPHARASQPPGRRRWPGRVAPAALVVLPLLLLGWVAVYALNGLLNPAATLTLYPRMGTVRSDITVRAVLYLAAARRGPYRLAMAAIAQPEQHTVPLPVRGIKILPGHVATGHLSLANLTTKPLFVPAGTAFTTALNRESFLSTAAITLPAAIETFSSTRYGTGVVPVQAELGGSSGNVAAKAIVNVPASLSGALKVENTAPTTGGTDRRERVVAPHDLAVAAASLFGALDQQAYHDIASRYNWDIEQHTLFVARSAVLPRVAPDRRTATLTLSVVVHAVYVHKHDLLVAATAALQRALAPGTRLIRSSVTWVARWRPDNTIALAVRGRTAPVLDVAALLGAIRGRSEAAAATYLRRQTAVASFDLALSPPWASHVPGDVARIHVYVAAPH